DKSFKQLGGTDNVEAYQQYAELLNSVGRPAEALNSSARALALDRSPIRLASYAAHAVSNGRYEEAQELALEGMSRDSEGNVDLLSLVLAQVYVQMGLYDEAEQVAGRNRVRFVPLIRVLRSEDPADAEQIPDPIVRAWVLMRLGQSEMALIALDGYRIDPPFNGRADLFFQEFDPVREDPRFQAVLAQMGLEGVEPVRAPSVGR
ncbi:MAG: tetratricopeptide repeat protein, partial [Gemmatimonadota bacterium]